MLNPSGLEWTLTTSIDKPLDNRAQAHDSTTLKQYSSSDDGESTVDYHQPKKPKDITWFDGGQKQTLIDKFITYQTLFNHSSSFA